MLTDRIKYIIYNFDQHQILNRFSHVRLSVRLSVYISSVETFGRNYAAYIFMVIIKPELI